MAFYNQKMAENKELSKAWRAGHRTKLGENEEICLPEICGEIAHWMRRDRRPRSRLSLRSFSVLLSGTIRLYRDQVDQLLRDTFHCSLFTKSAKFQAVKSINRETLSSGLISTENNPDDTKSPADKFDVDMSEDSIVFKVTPNNNEQSQDNEQEKNNTKRNQMVQTSPGPHIEENTTGFDPNLPFGYILIHDNYQSRIPSKILFSSLAENVKLLPIRKPMN